MGLLFFSGVSLWFRAEIQYPHTYSQFLENKAAYSECMYIIPLSVSWATYLEYFSAKGQTGPDEQR